MTAGGSTNIFRWCNLPEIIRYRMGIGSCPTHRGQCGTTATGAFMQGKIRVSEGCTDQWTISNLSKTDGVGSASTDQPVISPTAQDLSWGPCSSS